MVYHDVANAATATEPRAHNSLVSRGPTYCIDEGVGCDRVV